MAQSPKVSIGMPVYNGQRSMRKCLDSILAQTFQDFELIISDNASSDQTEQICREYAQEDPRISVVRYPVNLGALRESNQAFEMCQGELFLWAAGDDSFEPTYLQTCVDALARDEQTTLVYTATRAHDAEGNFVGVLRNDYRLDMPSPAQRFNTIVQRMGLCNMFYGVYRSSILRQTGLFRMDEWIGDVVVLADIALRGKIVQLDEQLFNRNIAGRSAETIQGYHTRLQRTLQGDRRRMGPLLPFCYLGKRHIELLLDVDLPAGEVNALVEMIRKVWPHRYGQQLVAEISRLIQLVLRGKFRAFWTTETDAPLTRASATKALSELSDARLFVPEVPQLDLARSVLLKILDQDDRARAAFDQAHKAKPGDPAVRQWAQQNGWVPKPVSQAG